MTGWGQTVNNRCGRPPTPEEFGVGKPHGLRATTDRPSPIAYTVGDRSADRRPTDRLAPRPLPYPTVSERMFGLVGRIERVSCSR